MNTFLPSISKEEINLLPVETYDGPIVVVDTEQDLMHVLALLENETVIGFDTETKPAFTKGRRNKVALLQVATPDVCFLIRLNKTGFPESLADFFNAPLVKVGLSIKDDLLMLRGRDRQLEPQGFVELQSLVKDYGIADNSLQKIYAIVFGKKLSKAQRLSNWEAEELSPGQKVYAALDAVACLRIHQELTQRWERRPLPAPSPKPELV